MGASSPEGKPDESNLFLVLGRSRTGSNLLIHMLRQHPSIVCKGEVFADATGSSWRQTLAELSSQAAPWTGFKMFYYHAPPDGELWRYLEADPDLPVVHMKRRNKLRAVVSRAIAAQTGQWAIADDDIPVAKRPVVLDPAELESDFHRTASAERQFAERFARHPYFEIEYEDLAASPQATYEEVTDFLGLPPGRATCVLRKQNPEPLSHLIQNYEELTMSFAGSRWSHYFSES